MTDPFNQLPTMPDDDFPDWPAEPLPGPLCAMCGDDGPLFPALCAERPEVLKGVPLGMYHCPDCGTMVLAGVEHPSLCAACIERTKLDARFS
jgi:hypothetical protein